MGSRNRLKIHVISEWMKVLHVKLTHTYIAQIEFPIGVEYGISHKLEIVMLLKTWLIGMSSLLFVIMGSLSFIILLFFHKKEKVKY